MITKLQDKILAIAGVFIPIIFSFILGIMVSAKIFNMEVPFSRIDYGIIIVSLYSVISHLYYNLKKELSQNQSNTKKEVRK